MMMMIMMIFFSGKYHLYQGTRSEQKKEEIRTKNVHTIMLGSRRR